MISKHKILLINGPNLSLLGQREPQLYGSQSLEDIVSDLQCIGSDNGIELSHMQSNSEGEIVDYIHEARMNCDMILINAGAYTHTSIAIRDAILAIQIPFIEIHMSNTFQRESFRHKSYLADIAQGIIIGLGAQSYKLALQGAIEFLQHKK